MTPRFVALSAHSISDWSILNFYIFLSILLKVCYGLKWRIWFYRNLVLRNSQASTYAHLSSIFLFAVTQTQYPVYQMTDKWLNLSSYFSWWIVSKAACKSRRIRAVIFRLLSAFMILLYILSTVVSVELKRLYADWECSARSVSSRTWVIHFLGGFPRGLEFEKSSW